LSPSPQKYGFGIRDPRSGIRKKPIPDPGSRGQKGTGSRIRIHNTGSEVWIRIRILLSSSNYSEKILDSYCFMTSFGLFILKNDVNVTSNEQKDFF
jgi:hypothetical protein